MDPHSLPLDDRESAPAPATGEGAKRSYNYNSLSVERLFANIVEALSLPDESGKSVGLILTDVCKHFRFGCGFVYEADHAHEFFLKENYTAYHPSNLPRSFRLAEHFSEDEMQELLRTSVFYQHSDDDNDADTTFGSNSFLLVAVKNREGAAIGLVGLMDRRRNILLDDHAIRAASMVLNLLANHVKLRLYQRNLEFAEQTLINILDNTGVDIYVNDFHTHEILYVNKSMAAPYGGREQMLGKKCWEAIYIDKTGQCEYCPQKKIIDDDGNPTKIYSWDYRRPFDGSWFRVLSAAFRWVDGRLAHVVSSVDITENKNNEALIAQMANFDALTNLPNRRKLMQDCARALENKDGEGYLFFFDLDRFKALNDGVGHQAGDQLLTEIGKALQKAPLTQNRTYRHGGDEFIILLDDVDREYARKVVKFLLQRFNQPWVLTGVSPLCKASIGVAAYPADANTADELLHHADQMMYKAKQNGPGIACFFDGETIFPTVLD